VIEYSSRLVEDQNKLSTRFNEIVEILYEASAWAARSGSGLVRSAHVEKAVEERVLRSRMIEEKLQEMIAKGRILVDTEGSVVGQVNGLTVYDLGDYSFGIPSRITACTYMGRSGIVNIEREIEMSGRIHSKGVLILSGYLGAKYAQDKPLALSASLCFEQTYDEIDGDSASSAELYALLSALSGIPLRQDIAVTGSVNQKGEIQPVGGVTKKIEGFYDICKIKGLTGKQGVLIPAQNVDNLMLREDVVEAVKQGNFHVYSITDVDDGIEVLTSTEAGRRDDEDHFPEGSVHYLVDVRLREWAEKMQEFRSQAEEGI
jgi:predicted ATP-dependent protease